MAADAGSAAGWTSRAHQRGRSLPGRIGDGHPTARHLRRRRRRRARQPPQDTLHRRVTQCCRKSINSIESISFFKEKKTVDDDSGAGNSGVEHRAVSERHPRLRLLEPQVALPLPRNRVQHLPGHSINRYPPTSTNSHQ